MILEKIIEQSDLEVKYNSIHKDEVKIQCLFCEERGMTADNRFLLGINIRNGFAHCFRCGWKSTSVLDTSRQLCRVLGLELDFRSLLRIQIEDQKPEPVRKVERPGKPTGLPSEYESFVGAQDSVERRAKRYLESRGVTALDIARHRIGFAAVGTLAWRILFPVFGENGKIYGCVGRDFSGRQKPKYKNTPGIKLLWGAHRKSFTVVVTEGVMDAVRVEKALLTRPPGTIAVAKLGSTITEIQLEQLRKYEKVVLLPDWDGPGVMGAITMAKACDRAGIRVSACIPECMNDSDPGDQSDDVILGQIDSAKGWNESTEKMLLQAKAQQRFE